MKKSLIIIEALVAFAACSKEPVSPVDNGNNEALTFTASADAGLTKVTLSDIGDGKYDIIWQTSDQICITDGTNSATYKPTTVAKQSPLTKYSGTEPTGPTFYAYYPSTNYNTTTGEFSLPELRGGYTTGGFYQFPMYAQSDNTDLSFKNVCGLLELSLFGTGDDKISRVVVTANENLCGVMTIVPDGGAYKAEIASGKKSVTVSFNTPYRTLSEGVLVRLPLPAGTYTGLTIEVFPSAGGVFYSKKVANKGIVIARSQVTPINLTSIAFNVTALSKGSGTSVDPYQIENESDIIALSNACRNGRSYSGKYLKVMNNITLTAAHKPFKLICEELDGNDKTITLNSGYDLSVVQSGEPYAGFISSLTGTVKNLTLAGADVSISAVESANVRSFGAIVGYNGTVRGCHNTINIDWTSSRTESTSPLAMGGISGTYSYVYDCENTGNLTFSLTNSANPTSALGGIIGVSGNTISGCSNSGTIYGDGVRYTGGLLGGTDSGLTAVTIDRSSNSGEVTGIYKYSNSSYCKGMAGGIAGSMVKGTITNCANTGAVIGQHNTTGYSGPIVLAGGIVGMAAVSNKTRSTIENCYNTADIIARTEYDNVGFKPFAAGISGRGGDISNCYTGGTIYTKAKSGGSYDNKAYGGAIIGYMWHDADPSYDPNYEGGVSYCYFPSQVLGGTTSNMRTIGYASKDAKETSNATTFYKGEDTGGTKFDATTLVSLASTTIGAVDYASGTDLVTLLNAGVAYFGGDLLTWKAGTGDPKYPVFN